MPKRFLYLSLLLFFIFNLTACTTLTSKNTLIRAGLNTEPLTLDPRFVTNADSETVVLQLFEGLTTLNEESIVKPAHAYAWEVSEDGLNYIFYLNHDAKWSNGDPLVADDYLKTWQNLLSTTSQNPYISNLFCLKNAKQIYKKQKSVDKLAVYALDNYTLSITLEQPTPYFLSLLSTPIFFPVHISSRNNESNTSSTSLISNGPFKLNKWLHNNKIELAKNMYYRDQANVPSLKLTFLISDSSSTRLSLFENNQLDFFLSPPTIDITRLKKENKLEIKPILSTYFYYFNVTKPPFDNLKVRKALTLAINRHEIIKNITKGEEKPALAFVPYGFANSNNIKSDFRTTIGNYFNDNELITAKELLKEAGYPDGKDFPSFNLFTDISEEHLAVTQAIQRMWQKNLNINCEIMTQEWKSFMQNINSKNYDIARSRWIADYPDPFSFLVLFDTDLTPTKNGWSNPEYNQMLKDANQNSDTSTRMIMLHAAENILINDFAIIPIFFYNDILCLSTRLHNVEHNSLGQIYFRHAYKD